MLTSRSSLALDEHESARVRAGELAQAGSDAVKHRLQVPLRVHVCHHACEPAHQPGALCHVVRGSVVLADPVADTHPADHRTANIMQAR